jgi:hypothetical protein
MTNLMKWKTYSNLTRVSTSHWWIFFPELYRFFRFSEEILYRTLSSWNWWENFLNFVYVNNFKILLLNVCCYWKFFPLFSTYLIISEQKVHYIWTWSIESPCSHSTALLNKFRNKNKQRREANVQLQISLSFYLISPKFIC